MIHTTVLRTPYPHSPLFLLLFHLFHLSLLPFFPPLTSYISPSLPHPSPSTNVQSESVRFDSRFLQCPFSSGPPDANGSHNQEVDSKFPPLQNALLNGLCILLYIYTCMIITDLTIVQWLDFLYKRKQRL